MKRHITIWLSALLIATAFTTGVYAPQIMNVVVTNFPLDANGSLRTSGNVTVNFPTQTTTKTVIPFNTTLRSAISMFPNTIVARNFHDDTFNIDATFYQVSMTLDLRDWKEYRFYAFSQTMGPLRQGPVEYPYVTGNGQYFAPFLLIYACFRPEFGVVGQPCGLNPGGVLLLYGSNSQV